MSDQEIKDILLTYRNYTVVGLSPKPERPSFEVTEFMKSKGHQIIGVNPGQTQIAGRPCYPDLRAAEAKARAAGIKVVSDRCLVIEWRRLGLP